MPRMTIRLPNDGTSGELLSDEAVAGLVNGTTRVAGVPAVIVEAKKVDTDVELTLELPAIPRAAQDGRLRPELRFVPTIFMVSDKARPLPGQPTRPGR